MSHSQTVPIEVNRPTPKVRPTDARLFLRDEELDRGAALLLMAEKALMSATARAMSEASLNRGEFDILLAIRARPGLSVTVLRRKLGMTVPTFARLLGRLDVRDLIAKAQGHEDARRRHLFLNDAGKALVEPLAMALRDALRAAYRTAGAEQVAGAMALLDALEGTTDG